MEHFQVEPRKLDLFSDRTSTDDFESNQLRVWFSSFAYVLMQALRHHALDQTEWAKAQCGTIRLKLLKVAAQIRVSVRWLLTAFSSACTGQAIFTQVYHHLQQLTRTG